MRKARKNTDARVSLTKKRRNGKRTLTNFGKTVVICLSVVLFLIVAIIVSVNMLIGYYYGLMNYIDVDNQSAPDFDEISRYIEAQESIDPTVTNTHDKEAADSMVIGGVDELDKEKEHIQGIVNILLVGIDNSGVSGDNTEYATRQNTDSMIVVTINEKTKRIVLTSLLRDCFVQIQTSNEGKTTTGRLNTASLYGEKALFATIDKNFGIKVDRIVKVDFSSFVDIVALVGGVDIYVTKAEAIEMNKVMEGMNEVFGDPINADKLKSTEAGVRHLNGKQALVYARIRYNTGNDFGRTERQRKLILAVADKIKTLNVGELNELLTTMLTKVSTNLTQSECTSLMANALSYLNYDMQSIRIPADGTYENGTVGGKSWLLLYDYTDNYRIWKDIVTGTVN